MGLKILNQFKKDKEQISKLNWYKFIELVKIQKNNVV